LKTLGWQKSGKLKTLFVISRLTKQRVDHGILIPMTDCQVIEASLKKYPDRYNAARVEGCLYSLEDI